MNNQSSVGREQWRVPASDIYETDEAYLVRLDLPGVSNEQLNVTYENGAVTIEGRISDAALEGYRCCREEYAAPGFRRVFTVSEQVDAAKIIANLKNGELLLELPKSETVKPRRINVTAA